MYNINCRLLIVKRWKNTLIKWSLIFSVLAVSSSAQALVIDTTVGWNGGESVAPFGDVDAGESYGQTFIAPSQHTVLTSFSFWVERAPFDTSNLPIDFSAFVMAWSGDRAVGPVLYQSTAQTVTEVGMQEFSFETGGLTLLPGESYIAFLNASMFWDGITSEARVGFRIEDIYPEGEFWNQNTGQQFENVTADIWSNTFPGSDLVFRANFVAEPATFALLGFGLAGFGVSRKRATA